MSFPARILARNTFNKIFLYIFYLNLSERFPEYLEILRKVSSLDFPFFIRDYNGRNIISKIDELIDDWGVNTRLRTKITQILIFVYITISASENALIFIDIPDESGTLRTDKKIKK